jgi:hypothetical protein
MANALDIGTAAGGLTIALVVLRLNLWRAILCVAPSSMRVERDDDGEHMDLPMQLEQLSQELRSFGFSAIGSRREKPALASPTVSYDFANPQERAFATLYLGRDGRPRLYFLTPTTHGGFVITANYRRPARQLQGRYLSGGLEHIPLERIYKAHQKRMEGFEAVGPFTLEGRIEAARAWFSGYGRSEIRQQNLHGLLWSVGTLGIVAAALFGRG